MQIKKIFYENNSHIKGKNKASKLGSQKCWLKIHLVQCITTEVVFLKKKNLIKGANQ